MKKQKSVKNIGEGGERIAYHDRINEPEGTNQSRKIVWSELQWYMKVGIGMGVFEFFLLVALIVVEFI
jgi:hypothetical protein